MDEFKISVSKKDGEFVIGRQFADDEVQALSFFINKNMKYDEFSEAFICKVIDEYYDMISTDMKNIKCNGEVTPMATKYILFEV